MRIKDNLFGKRKNQPENVKQAGEIPASAAAAPVPEKKEPYLTKKAVFGNHLYRREGEDSSVYFADERRNIQKLLVDKDGVIQNFPGIIQEDFWIKEISPNALRPQIRFRTSFEERGNGWIMLWQIQPDGRYWGDEGGFGIEKDEEIRLYTYINKDGDFTAPFRIYNVGNRDYTLDRFEAALTFPYPKYMKQLKSGDLNTSNAYELLFPQMFSGGRRKYYDIQDREEALAYAKHPVLSANLTEAAKLLLAIDKNICCITNISGQSCIMSSMTLFSLLTGETVFRDVLDKFFDGKYDEKTAEMLEEINRK